VIEYAGTAGCVGVGCGLVDVLGAGVGGGVVDGAGVIGIGAGAGIAGMPGIGIGLGGGVGAGVGVLGAGCAGAGVIVDGGEPVLAVGIEEPLSPPHAASSSGSAKKKYRTFKGPPSRVCA
jgi:hypothetical protein